MRFYYLICFLLCLLSASFLSAQQYTWSGQVLMNKDLSNVEVPNPWQNDCDWISFHVSQSHNNDEADLSYRYRVQGAWSEWRKLSIDAHGPAESTRFYELQFLESDFDLLELRKNSENSRDQDFEITLRQIILNRKMPSSPSVLEECNCSQPTYVPRSSWGGPPNQASGCVPAIKEASHLIIHHQAGVANPPYDAVVLGIWQFHTISRGWCDIGYNWVIAPDGTLFEGRYGGDDVIGAHFCGNNSGTLGIVMLGNLSEETPSPEAISTLESLLTWNACRLGLSPLGESFHESSSKNLFHISGHMDGCATECPGNNMYPLLPAIRQAVNDTLEGCTVVNNTEILKSAARLYPNPASSTIHIDYPPNILVRRVLLTDLYGQVYEIGQNQAVNSRDIDVSLFSPGMYLVALQDDTGRQTILNDKLIILKSK